MSLCGTDDKQTTEDRATQPMQWKLEAEFRNMLSSCDTFDIQERPNFTVPIF